MKTDNAKPTRPRGDAQRGKKVKKVDWAFRRLRNQAIAFLSRGDKSVRRELREVLSRPRTFSEMEAQVLRIMGPRNGRTAWHKFLDRFFGHEINRQVGA